METNFGKTLIPLSNLPDKQKHRVSELVKNRLDNLFKEIRKVKSGIKALMNKVLSSIVSKGH